MTPKQSTLSETTEKEQTTPTEPEKPQETPLKEESKPTQVTKEGNKPGTFEEEVSKIVAAALEKDKSTTAVAKVVPQVGERGIELRNLDDLFKFGTFAIKAGLCPPSIKTPEAAALVVQYGMELGLTPMASLQTIYVVGNRPAIFGPIGVGLVEASGQRKHFKEYFEGDEKKMDDDFTAVCEIQRRDDAEITIKKFSVADAKRAGLWMVNTWRTYPRDMLQYKATWRALYSRFADILKGVAPREFADEWVEASKVEVIDPGKSKTDQLAEKLKNGK